MSHQFSFYYEETQYRIPDSNWLVLWMESIFTKEGRAFEQIEYILCSDEYLLRINNKHLNHDYYTDIITFPLSKDPIEANIFISIDRIKDNAIEFKQVFEDELHRVMAHGILHLIGYNDKTQDDKRSMRLKENEYLETRSEYK